MQNKNDVIIICFHYFPSFEKFHIEFTFILSLQGFAYPIAFSFLLSVTCMRNTNCCHMPDVSQFCVSVVQDSMQHLISFQEYLPDIMDSFRPDIILYDAGVDPHEKDELGKLKLSDDGTYASATFFLN